MPPPGALYSSTHKPRTGDFPLDASDMGMAYRPPQMNAAAGPSRPHDEGKKKRKDLSGKLGKEMNDRRDDGRHYSETISALHGTALQLSTRPETVPLFTLRLLPLTIERSALLAQIELEEKYALECARITYDEERERVEEEWRRGRDRVRERLMEGIEDRRKRAREEKEGEGTSADASMDAQSRQHITRKLRNKIGTSPPPTPLGAPASVQLNGGLNAITITNGPFLNPHSLSVDEIPSPFPLPLTSLHSQTGPGGTATVTGAPGGTTTGKRRPKGGGAPGPGNGARGGRTGNEQLLSICKESEIESDMLEIRRGGANKRRRTGGGKGMA
ncbi:hypothetical protein C8J56DRAFT_979430 [Mycena floridula]|nr:hypothetical protein C8J56DRAFT_994178 [Mycena floridula]KAJ7574345.1 hypothetical protein C8J56DRAFT_979430 [Mycena floridula]